MINLKNLLFFVCLAFCMQSCISNKAFQTARTTPAGDKGFGFGVALPNAEFYDINDSGVTTDTTNLGGFAMEFFGRYGVTDKIDAGVNFTLLGTAGADVKYQFLGDSESPLAASVGAGFGYLSFGSGEDDGNSNSIIDITIPAYISYHAGSALGIYASPRYIFRKAGDNSSNFGVVGGLRLGGERSGVFIEYGYLKSGSDNYADQTQINVGFGIGIR